MRAVDSAGNFDPSPATYSWIVDRAGVYGQPSMVTDVIADGGNKKVWNIREAERATPVRNIYYKGGVFITTKRHCP